MVRFHGIKWLYKYICLQVEKRFIPSSSHENQQLSYDVDNDSHNHSHDYISQNDASSLFPLASPLHIAIIMDGNGRWAQSHGAPRLEGHVQGTNVVSQIVRASAQMQLDTLTLYSFSTENWTRPQQEIDHLMKLFKLYLDKHIDEIATHNIRIHFLGRRDNLPPDILAYIARAESKTHQNDGMNLCIAFNYGGRDEITRAITKIAQDVLEHKLTPDDICESKIETYLDSHDIRAPDIIIRTSGEQRLSNFLIWQSAYSEFFFLDKNWPDFSQTDLEEVIARFHNRKRRFGGVENV